MSNSTIRDATTLPKGVSCDVWIQHDEAGREIVLKQPLEKLNVVADWHSRLSRFDVEVRALTTVASLLGQTIVPKVLWVDAARSCFAMERIDPRLRNWKLDLLAGKMDLRTANRVGTLLGMLQSASANHPDIPRDFANQAYFEELRIEPFFLRVAQANPNLRAGIDLAVAALRAPGTTLVHGDFSPKNLLADASDVVVLDWEIAHWGNPRFDIAFMLSHLILKGSRKVDAAPYLAAANAFLDGYVVESSEGILDSMLVRLIGCLLLSRFEGASPVDYRDQLDAPTLKSKSSTLILNPIQDVRAVLQSFLSSTR
jgi:thiamine kinase-like enzyme